MDQVVVIDLGGTKIAGGVANREGELEDLRRIPTPAQAGGKAVVAAVVELVRDLQQSHANALQGIGIGCAGVVDSAGRSIAASTDAIRAWAQTPIADLVERAAGLPVTLENDVCAHLRGEAWKGAGEGKTELVMMALGTGIGGAVMMGGKILYGPHGTAGDFGHMSTLLPTKRACSCGRDVAHLEAVASGPGLYAWYLEKGGNPKVSGAKELEQLALSGDALARETYEEVGGETGRALGSIVNIFDPQAVIVGGGLANSGEVWWEPLRRAYRAELVDVLQEVPVLKARLGNQAALVGAAKKIWNYLKEKEAS